MKRPNDGFIEICYWEAGKKCCGIFECERATGIIYDFRQNVYR